MNYKILIVEDEEQIVHLIRNRLDESIYDITVASTGDQALNYIQKGYFDLVSLDIMLPSVDGLTLCEEVRKRYKDSLILIVSALDLEESKEKAYLLGADDYIPKPFSPKLLTLKMATLLKRRAQLTEVQTQLEEAIYHDRALKRFYIKGEALTFTLSEYAIFETLFNTPNKVFSKEELSQILYNEEIGNIDKEGIGTHIYQLRKKIAKLSDKNIIKTVRSIGYTLYED